MWLSNVCLFIISINSGLTYLKPSVYQKIRQSPKLTKFSSLLELNRPAKLNLQYGEMTVFAPTNEAFEWYSSGNIYDVINYHMVWYSKHIHDLKEGPLSTVIEENPPVWITKVDNDTFVNNARIIPEMSDYVSVINIEPKKEQVLHIIDEVLNPVVKRAPLAVINPTAFDFLAKSMFWDIGPYKVQQFYRAVVNNQQEGIYKSSGSSTYFIPIDETLTEYRLGLIDSDVISGHVIPNRVLFTRATPKDQPMETLSNSDSLYVVLVLTGGEGQLSVLSHILVGDSNHSTGDIKAEIVKANIPVRNGVIHLIKRPLVILNNKLTLFPLWPILDKLQSDPSLTASYHLGEESSFNVALEGDFNKRTYFVPRNKAWKVLGEYLNANESFVGDFAEKYGKSILDRHLIISNVSYTIEDLQRRSNLSDIADINLYTMGGVLQIGIGETVGKYVIHWRDKVIPIHRANWVCTNGIIHVVDDVFVTREDILLLDKQEEPGPNPLKVLNLLMRVML